MTARRRWLGAAARVALAVGLGSSVSGAALLAGCGRRGPRGRPVPAGATVLALGDSLTFGTGAEPASAYPALLSGLTGWNVVNAGVPGDTSAQALERLPALLDEHQPALVLVGIGGNDLLRRGDPAALAANLRRIAERARAAGAQVMLIAVPAPSLGAAAFGSLDDHSLYADVAGEAKLPLHAGGWSSVLSDAALRSDRIHANAAGYARFAEGLAVSLREAGFLAR